MTEYEALRREIEVRIWRETIFKAVQGFKGELGLNEELETNDKHIELLGQYLDGKTTGDEGWEKFYKENKPK